MEEYGYRQNSDDNNPEPVTMQEWLITMLILMIPIMNLVMPFKWSIQLNNMDINKTKTQI